MTDSMDNEGAPAVNVQQLAIIFAIVAICLLFWNGYCFRRTEPADDPANDPRWIPSPSSSTPNTQSLEERRADIESRLIVRRVLEASNSARSNKSSVSSTNQRSWTATSDRQLATFMAAFATRRSPSERVIRFSEPLGIKRSKSTPLPQARQEPRRSVSSPAALTEQQAASKNNNNNNNEDDKDPPEEDEENPSFQDEQQTAPEAPSCCKHRRKTDIVVRSIASMVRSQPMDYDQPTTCDICLMDYEAGEEVAWSCNDGCCHAFHKECIVDWLLRNPKCPICRRDYLHNSKDNDNNTEGNV